MKKLYAIAKPLSQALDDTGTYAIKTITSGPYAHLAVTDDNGNEAASVTVDESNDTWFVSVYDDNYVPEGEDTDADFFCGYSETDFFFDMDAAIDYCVSRIQEMRA